jgi:arsenate reductase (glutaredoxin)
MAYIIYHNPRCSKSRETLSILNENQCSVKVIEYLKDVPTIDDLESIKKCLGIGSIHQVMRTKEALYIELGLNENSNESTLLNAIVANPILLERPIVLKNKKAVIGRPPESVTQLF